MTAPDRNRGVTQADRRRLAKSTSVSSQTPPGDGSNSGSGSGSGKPKNRRSVASGGRKKSRALAEVDAAIARSREIGVPFLDLDNYLVDPTIGAMIPVQLAKRVMAVPVNRSGANLTVAMADPRDSLAITEIERLTDCMVKPVIATRTSIRDTIDKLLQDNR